MQFLKQGPATEEARYTLLLQLTCDCNYRLASAPDEFRAEGRSNPVKPLLKLFRSLMTTTMLLLLLLMNADYRGVVDDEDDGDSDGDDDDDDDNDDDDDDDDDDNDDDDDDDDDDIGGCDDIGVDGDCFEADVVDKGTMAHGDCILII